MKPDVEVGVSVVESPITPNFIPFKLKISEDLCLGKKLGSPFSEYRLAPSEGEFFALR